MCTQREAAQTKMDMLIRKITDLEKALSNVCEALDRLSGDRQVSR